MLFEFIQFLLQALALFGVIGFIVGLVRKPKDRVVETSREVAVR